MGVTHIFGPYEAPYGLIVMTFDLRKDDPFRRNRSDYPNNELEF